VQIARLFSVYSRHQWTVRPVQLSILLPTNRHDLLACSRVLQACSWAGPNIEVIVRDNSGNAQKRAMLSQVQRDNCKVILAEPCGPRENFAALLPEARGDFVFCAADDDMGFDRGIAALPAIIDQITADPAVVGISGPYAVEASQASVIINYQGMESDDVGVRLVGYLNETGPNVLLYSALRRTVFTGAYELLKNMPFAFSFHDQILSMLYLMNGRFVRLPRLFYLYDFGDWEVVATAQRRDVMYYTGAGLDPAINRLHWYLCAFEGAVLIMHSDAFLDYPLDKRQALANHWFVSMYTRFKTHLRLTFDSPFATDMEKICEKLTSPAAPTSFDGMLAEITAGISVFSQAHAQEYFAFWDSIVNKRAPLLRSSVA
jgi:hypothetical protein